MSLRFILLLYFWMNNSSRLYPLAHELCSLRFLPTLAMSGMDFISWNGPSLQSNSGWLVHNTCATIIPVYLTGTEFYLLQLQNFQLDEIGDFYFFMCMDVLSSSIHHLHTQCLWRPVEGVRSPGSWITDNCQLLCSCWESKPRYSGRTASALYQ